MTPTL